MAGTFLVNIQIDLAGMLVNPSQLIIEGKMNGEVMKKFVENNFIDKEFLIVQVISWISGILFAIQFEMSSFLAITGKVMESLESFAGRSI